LRDEAAAGGGVKQTVETFGGIDVLIKQRQRDLG